MKIRTDQKINISYKWNSIEERLDILEEHLLNEFKEKTNNKVKKKVFTSIYKSNHWVQDDDKVLLLINFLKVMELK